VVFLRPQFVARLAGFVFCGEFFMSTEQDERNEFSAVFGEEPAPVAASDEPDPIEETEVVVEETQPEPEAEPVEEEVTEPEPKPSLEDELRQLREQVTSLQAMPDHIRRLDGRYGELHRAQQQMQQTKVQLSPDKFKKLSESFPELAEALASDLSDAFAPAPSAPAPSFDPNQFESAVNSRVSEALNRQEQKFNLTMKHPDWKETANSDGFRQWVSAQPGEIQNALANSWDADFISQQMSAYKQASAPPAPKVSAKAKVIQAAVTPAGSRSSMPATDSEASAFLRAAGG
jgi:hypothetical protein